MSKAIRFQHEIERTELPLSRKISFLEVVENEDLLDDYVWQEVFREFNNGIYPADVAKENPHDFRLLYIFTGCIVEFPGAFFNDAKKQYFANKARYLETGELPSE